MSGMCEQLFPLSGICNEGFCPSPPRFGFAAMIAAAGRPCFRSLFRRLC